MPQAAWDPGILSQELPQLARGAAGRNLAFGTPSDTASSGVPTHGGQESGPPVCSEAAGLKS